MKVLIACENSGQTREAFARKGIYAMSCDLLPSKVPGNHYQGDVRDVLNDGWDLMIAHPDCTYLSISAAWAFKDGPYHQKVKPGTLVGEERRQARQEAIEFAELLWSANIPMIAIENPVGALSTMSKLGEPSQIIQPYEYGDNASKKTCLWLKNLPKLKPLSVPYPPRLATSNGGRSYAFRWGNQTDSGQNRLPPSESRAQTRSITYTGWSEAMANQWGAVLSLMSAS